MQTCHHCEFTRQPADTQDIAGQVTSVKTETCCFSLVFLYKQEQDITRLLVSFRGASGRILLLSERARLADLC